jgi:hypothetical protein
MKLRHTPLNNPLNVGDINAKTIRRGSDQDTCFSGDELLVYASFERCRKVGIVGSNTDFCWASNIKPILWGIRKGRAVMHMFGEQFPQGIADLEDDLLLIDINNRWRNPIDIGVCGILRD